MGNANELQRNGFTIEFAPLQLSLHNTIKYRTNSFDFYEFTAYVLGNSISQFNYYKELRGKFLQPKNDRERMLQYVSLQDFASTKIDFFGKGVVSQTDCNLANVDTLQLSNLNGVECHCAFAKTSNGIGPLLFIPVLNVDDTKGVFTLPAGPKVDLTNVKPAMELSMTVLLNQTKEVEAPKARGHQPKFYGCYNRPPYKDVAHHSSHPEVSWPDHMSKNCQYDYALTDPMCSGCKWAEDKGKRTNINEVAK